VGCQIEIVSRYLKSAVKGSNWGRGSFPWRIPPLGPKNLNPDYFDAFFFSPPEREVRDFRRFLERDPRKKATLTPILPKGEEELR